MVARVFWMYKWLPLPDNHPQKGEIPASSLTRGSGLKRFCSELPGGLLPRVNLANPGLRAPRPEPIPIPLNMRSRGGGYLLIDTSFLPFRGVLPGTFPGRVRAENNVVLATD